MNKIISIISIISAVLLVSCAEDRSYEYEQLTQHNIWMYEQMSDKYLWADKLPEQTWKNYFAYPQDYFATLIKSGTNDYASYIVVDSLKSADSKARGHYNHTSSYGFDFDVMTDPTGKSANSFARVITVYDDSPASKAGLKRNDFIATFNTYKISDKNKSKLEKGDSLTLAVCRLTTNLETQDYEWTDSREVKLGASYRVEDKAFPVHKVFTNADNSIITQGDKVGYLMCNRLTDKGYSKDSAEVDYKSQMDAIISEFNSQDVNQLVLDLRLCNDGTMEMARRLASYIVPPAAQDKVFAKTVWNTKYSANNETILFDSSLAAETLDLDYVTVITSSYTQGASEWLIRALQYALGSENVMIVGAKTKGQHCMSQHIGDYDNMIHIYPAVASVLSGDETEASTGSINPANAIDEFNYVDIYEYGDIREILLFTAIEDLYAEDEESESAAEAKFRR